MGVLVGGSGVCVGVAVSRINVVVFVGLGVAVGVAVGSDVFLGEDPLPPLPLLPFEATQGPYEIGGIR